MSEKFYNSRHNDPTVIILCQNVRLSSAKLSVKFQLDCDTITENFPIACVHVSTKPKARLAPRDSSITPDIMIQQ